MARGLDALTIRTLGRTRAAGRGLGRRHLPDRRLASSTRSASGGTPTSRPRSHRSGTPSKRLRRPVPRRRWRRGTSADSAPLGLDAQTTTVNLVRRDLFARGWQAPPAAGSNELATDLPRRPACPDPPARASGTSRTSGSSRSSSPIPASSSRSSCASSTERPTVGLIVDVRGNGGGDIRAAERLLQVLTPRRIEPEPAQFIVSPLIRRLCIANQADPIDLRPWTASCIDAVETGATFSTGFPIGSGRRRQRSRARRYYGPVVLITDARCYSATDIFAAGFQDHEIGRIVGVAERTGAGGANVWTHDLLRQLLPVALVAAQVAARRGDLPGGDPSHDPGRPARGRAARGPRRRGPTASIAITYDDLLHDNRDLIDAAVAEMAGGPPDASRRRSRVGADTVTVEVQTAKLDRVDAYVDGRPVGSADVRGRPMRLPSAPRR